tara:strand:- start:80 stop:364 length:285 start_codon:yes stop_codon:yes gene_type:complete
MDKILSDIRQLIIEADEDQILEFTEMLMVQNKQLIADNKQLVLQCQQFMKDFEPEPEPEGDPEPHPVFEGRGLEKIEHQEDQALEKLFEGRSSV